MPQTDNLPRHIAVLMDGNGRWAEKRGRSRTFGHHRGAENVEVIVNYCRRIGVPFLTLYAFSSENWSRPKQEVDTLMDLFRRYLADCERRADDGVRMRFIGDRTPLAPDLADKMTALEAATARNTAFTLVIAINYGGRDEIVRAAAGLARLASEGALDPGRVDAAAFAAQLDTAGIPDPDLLIRPGGEMRLSNFLLWQCAYAEFVFTDVLWPDFTPAELDAAIARYRGRNRRFGSVSP